MFNNNSSKRYICLIVLKKYCKKGSNQFSFGVTDLFVYQFSTNEWRMTNCSVIFG